MRFPVTRLLAAACGAVLTASAFAMPNPNLQITEVMYNTKNTTETLYGEWIEIRNTSASPIDLDGYYLQRVGGNVQASFNPVVRSAVAANTIVPANGVAVLYDGFYATGSSVNYNDALFRQTWGLAPTVSVIAGDFFPGLNNSQSSYGLWASVNDAILDGTESTTTPGSYTINGTTNAATSVSYDIASPWPANTDGVSIQWNGSGDAAVGSNWALSQSGVNGATTSTLLTTTGATNSTADRGSPGLVLGGTPVANKLIITEVMYNPAGTEPNWEWLEVYNNTGSAINFATTPYYLDDNDQARLASPNLATGAIPQGGVAVLFNDAVLDITDMQAAWGASINFIPASVWNDGLGNAGDTIAIWNSQASYQLDIPTTNTANNGSQANAISFVNYKSAGTGTWPTESNGQSIFLTNLGLDQTQGGSWLRSDGTGVDTQSYNPQALNGTITVHPGGDIGSPGSFSVIAPPSTPGDYNNNGTVDQADYTLWASKLGQPVASAGLVNLNPAKAETVIDASDYTFWRDLLPGGGALAAAAAVPEPATLLLALPLVGLALRRRQ